MSAVLDAVGGPAVSWATERARLLGAAAPVTDLEPIATPRCLAGGCGQNAVDIAYCADHRRMADDGTLWLRCVNCSSPVAPNNPLACAEHQRQMDAIPMPWEKDQ